jgi:hypothetical protein
MNYSDATPETQSDRCLFYLLGELDESSAKKFEQDLAQNLELHRELLRQAELISTLEQVDYLVPLPDAIVAPVEDLPIRNTSGNWAILFASIAACLLIAVIGGRFLMLRDVDVALVSDDLNRDAAGDHVEIAQIAEAWASTQLESEVINDETLDSASEMAFDFAADGPTPELESTLSWMFAAIAASPELLPTEANNGS